VELLNIRARGKRQAAARSPETALERVGQEASPTT
jgi:hypothetical protein